MKKNKKYTPQKTEYGFYSASPLPSQKELDELYRTYYQNKKVGYQPEYSDEELRYFRIQARVADYIFDKTRQDKNTIGNDTNSQRIFLDVGTGEGFFAKYFYENNWRVVTCDFSDFGMARHNPKLFETFIKGDIFDTLGSQIESKRLYDFINLKNVLEHVLDPVRLLTQIGLLMKNDSILRIEVPNDYSVFQQMLLENKMTENTWFVPPEHLHYFSFESIQTFLQANGFRIENIMADFPIELYILNPESNYAKNKSLGKNAHLSRIRANNFIYDQGIENYIQYFSAAANVNMGRQVIVYVSKQGNSI